MLAGLTASGLLSPWTLGPASAEASARQASAVHDLFPSHDPLAAREVVGLSHSNFARVKELVTNRPALAKASWDGGFGDWETALGAASHVGQRDIARLLIDHGAPPTIFSAAMLGQLDVVKAFVAASPGIQRHRGPHGIPLLSHAEAGGPEAAAVVAYLKEIGGADERPALAPLSPQERASILGTYRFADGPRGVFVVDVDARDRLGMTRGGGDRRNLFHLGALVFYPTGAEAVRITFERAGDRVSQFTIADPGVVLTAIRSA